MTWRYAAGLLQLCLISMLHASRLGTDHSSCAGCCGRSLQHHCSRCSQGSATCLQGSRGCRGGGGGLCTGAFALQLFLPCCLQPAPAPVHLLQSPKLGTLPSRSFCLARVSSFPEVAVICQQVTSSSPTVQQGATHSQVCADQMGTGSKFAHRPSCGDPVGRASLPDSQLRWTASVQPAPPRFRPGEQPDPVSSTALFDRITLCMLDGPCSALLPAMTLQLLLLLRPSCIVASICKTRLLLCCARRFLMQSACCIQAVAKYCGGAGRAGASTLQLRLPSRLEGHTDLALLCRLRPTLAWTLHLVFHQTPLYPAWSRCTASALQLCPCCAWW